MREINCENIAAGLARLRLLRIEVGKTFSILREFATSKLKDQTDSANNLLQRSRLLSQSTDELRYSIEEMMLATDEDKFDLRIIQCLGLKTRRKMELSTEELNYIYNIFHEKLKDGAYFSTSDVAEYEKLLRVRDLRADGVRLYEIRPDEVATTHAEISDQTRVYMGLQQYEVVRPHNMEDILRLSRVRRLRTDMTDAYNEYKSSITEWFGTIVDYTSSTAKYENLRWIGGGFVADQATEVDLSSLEEIIGCLRVYAKKSLRLDELKRSAYIHSSARIFCAPNLTAASGELNLESTEVDLPKLLCVESIWADQATEIRAENLREVILISALRAKKIVLPQLKRCHHLFFTRTTAMTVKEIILPQETKTKIVWQPEE